jgi:hypothetical protein
VESGALEQNKTDSSIKIKVIISIENLTLPNLTKPILIKTSANMKQNSLT